MPGRTTRGVIYGFAVIGALTASGTALAQEPVPDELAKRAVQIVAAEQGIDERELALAAVAQGAYPVRGESVFDFKVRDPRGDVHGVTLDRGGDRQDPAALADAERRARLERFGRLDPRLAERVAAADPDERLDVILWLQAPQDDVERPDLGRQGSLEELAAFHRRVDAIRARTVGTVAEPVLERLKDLGVEATADTHAPVVHVSAPARLIREIAELDAVDTVYAAGTNAPEIDVSVPTVRGTTVKSLGITGAGVDVAQIEVGGRVATGNPHLSGTAQDATSVCGSASDHSTAVAGIIRARHWRLPWPFPSRSREGMAPGVNLRAAGSCSGADGELQGRSTAAANAGARALNLSWGSNIGLAPGANDRFFDDMVRSRARVVVKSAGNQDGPCGAGDGNVTSPGLGYNVTAVGNVDDRNTTAWGDDAMAACSSWRDPSSTHGDREKPEVAAPGENITSTTTSFPFMGGVGGGTSFAAPLVTGDAAMLIERVPLLGAWPETVKAIQTATAMHNVEGATRRSERDGAGAIDAHRADLVARRSGGDHGGRFYACGTGRRLDLGRMRVGTRGKVRAALAWSVDTSWADYAQRPSTDLDLQVVDPNGAVVASSLSWDDATEIAEFTPTIRGTYTLRANEFRCDRATWMGWAWRQG